jgi:hypothetical protein
VIYHDNRSHIDNHSVDNHSVDNHSVDNHSVDNHSGNMIIMYTQKLTFVALNEKLYIRGHITYS